MDYTELLNQVVDTLDGVVTTTQVAAMLPIVEARFNRIIESPDREATAYQTVTDDVTLPTDCWELTDVWLDGTPPKTLHRVSGDTARTQYGTATGSPVAYVLTGSEIDLFPTPEATSTDVVYIRYRTIIPALTGTNTTNWLGDSHPDIYYYSLLLQCEAFIANDERLGIWKAALDEALGELNASSARRQFGTAPLVPYLSAP